MSFGSERFGDETSTSFFERLSDDVRAEGSRKQRASSYCRLAAQMSETHARLHKNTRESLTDTRTPTFSLSTLATDVVFVSLLPTVCSERKSWDFGQDKLLPFSGTSIAHDTSFMNGVAAAAPLLTDSQSERNFATQLPHIAKFSNHPYFYRRGAQS